MGVIAIGRGSCRLTICIGPWAIKIARNATGRRCNRGEADRWKRAQTNPARRAMLCPVRMRLPGGIALIMQRAQPLSEAAADHLLETDGFPDWDYVPPDDEGHPFEYKASDWGRLPDGRLVSIDYSTHELGEPDEEELLRRHVAAKQSIEIYVSADADDYEGVGAGFALAIENNSSDDTAILSHLRVRARWIFHKNDPDPWPSGLHGHHTSLPLKLDAITGNIFDIRTRQCIERVKRKELGRIRDKLLASKDFAEMASALLAQKI